MPTQIQIEKKLSLIENELSSLKAVVLKLSQTKAPRKVLKLEGELTGVSVTEKGLNAAKKSLFKADAA